MLCLDHRRVTDKFENAVIDRHVYPGMREWPHTTEWVRSGGGFYQGASVAGTRWQHRSPWATAQVQVRQVWRLRPAVPAEEGHPRSQRDEASIAQEQPHGTKKGEEPGRERG